MPLTLVGIRLRVCRPIIIFLLGVRAMNEDERINLCKTSVNRIITMLGTSPQDWRSYLPLARSVMGHIDTTTFIREPSRTSEQSWMIAGLQRLAYADIDNGEVRDIADWCTRQWTTIYQRDSQNIAALKGIGQAWLSRAQPALTRIHLLDSSLSSSGGSSSWSVPSITSSEDERQNAAAVADAERRAGTEDYVEARGFLLPSVEYFERAVAAALAQQTLSGDLLTTVRTMFHESRIYANRLQAAEAYMSLGNTSSPRTNERYFRRALQLLLAATSIPGYTLSRYLQQ